MKKIVALSLCLSLVSPNLSGIEFPAGREYLTSMAIASTVTYLLIKNIEFFSKKRVYPYNEIDIEDPYLPNCLDSFDEEQIYDNTYKKMFVPSVSATINGIIGSWLSVPFTARGESLLDKVIINVGSSTFFFLCGYLMGYIYPQYLEEPSCIEKISVLEEDTVNKHGAFISIAYKLRDGLLQEKQQEAYNLFFSDIQRQNILLDSPLTEAGQSYKIIILRMNRILKYIEKAKSNAPSESQKIMLDHAENKAKSIIQCSKTALLLIKQHPVYYKATNNSYNKICVQKLKKI